ncbi:hypothetical protein K504DRAFT_24980 [Pleomassaria siparia CBS 279.74]|uniref:Acid protease n=1 Tax=Pleomassaria siparia CBS 279.74 TaxID=1314801 RepID=A0A6G1KR86_9PLEO|nr:hypothetical protein K504DRAFT_24980 [Pleomassaria siparia CBS 279.74]
MTINPLDSAHKHYESSHKIEMHIQYMPRALSSAPTCRQMSSTSYKNRLRIAIVFTLLSSYLVLKHLSSILMPSNREKSDLSRYTNSIFLPYVHKFHTQHVPMVHATISGIDFELPMDTGSTGVMIGAPRLPHISPDEGIPAYEYLSSSRILYSGRLVDQNITFHGADGTYAMAAVPILVVDRSMVCPWYKPGVDGFECPHIPGRPYPEPRDVSHITYMGVGFGRNRLEDKKLKALPRGNPFLNVASINGVALPSGSLRAGYTISTLGVHLGLTRDNTIGFLFTDLERGATSDARDWAMMKTCFRINGQGNNCGSALIDTGIPQMYIRTDVGVDLPNVTVRNPNRESETEWVKRVKPGTDITIGFPTLEGSEHVVGYSFKVDQGLSVMEPAYVVPEAQAPPPYVNTGRNFLFSLSVAFDAEGGRFGLKPLHSPSSQTVPSSL